MSGPRDGTEASAVIRTLRISTGPACQMSNVDAPTANDLIGCMQAQRAAFDTGSNRCAGAPAVLF